MRSFSILNTAAAGSYKGRGGETQTGSRALDGSKVENMVATEV